MNNASTSVWYILLLLLCSVLMKNSPGQELKITEGTHTSCHEALHFISSDINKLMSKAANQAILHSFSSCFLFLSLSLVAVS